METYSLLGFTRPKTDQQSAGIPFERCSLCSPKTLSLLPIAMHRKLAILTSFCLGILCAFVYKFGTLSLDGIDNVVEQTTVVSCQQLLSEWPSDNYHLRMTDYQRGQHVAFYDHDQDKNWELVYVPLFPAHLSEVGNNYRAVIVHFNDVKNEQELDERLASGELDSQLWYTQQTLPSAIHSDLAQKYRLMNISGCVVLQGGFQPPNGQIAKSAVLGSRIGMIACTIVAIWNLLALVPSMQQHYGSTRDEEEEDAPVSNRAGLPEY